jgi:hypothetical protein
MKVAPPLGLAGTLALLGAGIAACRTNEPPRLADLPQTALATAQSADAVTTCYLDQGDHQHYADMPEAFSSAFPVDAYQGVDVVRAKAGNCPTDLLKVRRLHDVFSWKNLLALQWPVDTEGKPLPRFTDAGAPRWKRWKDLQEIFRPNGEAPMDWGAPRAALPELGAGGLPDRDPFAHFLLTRKTGEGVLWDQNGNQVYYQVLLNKTGFDYIRDNDLYHVEGQACFRRARPAGGVEFPFDPRLPDTGPVTVKFAWKVLAGGDVRGRFFTMPAYVPGDAGKKWKQVEVALVGIHVARRPRSAKQWIWSTFEHVDNVEVTDEDVLAHAQRGERLRPSFFNPACPTCAINSEGTTPTQVARVLPIHESTAALNRRVRALLQQQGSIWQYYQLVGTQYPAEPTSPPAGPREGPASIVNRSGGRPTPAFLTNAVLETFHQKGNRAVVVDRGGKETTLFATESCTGCHFDAGLPASIEADGTAKKREPGTADFSYVFERAQSRKGYTCKK